MEKPAAIFWMCARVFPRFWLFRFRRGRRGYQLGGFPGGNQLGILAGGVALAVRVIAVCESVAVVVDPVRAELDGVARDVVRTFDIRAVHRPVAVVVDPVRAELLGNLMVCRIGLWDVGRVDPGGRNGRRNSVAVVVEQSGIRIHLRKGPGSVFGAGTVETVTQKHGVPQSGRGGE